MTPINKKHVALAAATALLVAACGGGGGSSAAAPDAAAPAANAVATASSATANQLALAAVPTSSANETAYDVTADIGDTWRIVLDTANLRFTVKILNTQYGLTDRTGTYTASTSGDRVTYSGTDFSLVVDTRTRMVTGSIKVGSRVSTVVGTGYAVSDVAKLAGTYLFMGATRNLDASNPDRLLGGLLVKADGSVSVCDGGVFDAAGACTQVPGLPAPSTQTLQLARNATSGVIEATLDGHSFGTVQVHAGDRGPVLLIDRFGPNESGVLRVGTIVATKPAALTTADTDGNYSCSMLGVDIASVAIAGGTATISEVGGGKHEEIVELNKVSNGSALVDVAGVASLRVATDPAYEAVPFLPVSASAGFVFSDSPFPLVCRKG